MRDGNCENAIMCERTVECLDCKDFSPIEYSTHSRLIAGSMDSCDCNCADCPHPSSDCI